MREVYLMSKGESIEKIKKQYRLSDIDILHDIEILNSKCLELKHGSDDITIVRNYLPYIEYIVKNEETVLDLMSRGFEVNVNCNISEGDLIILRRPRSIMHQVKPLETIDDIAKKYGVTVDYIMEVNYLTIEKLFIGQILWI